MSASVTVVLWLPLVRLSKYRDDNAIWDLGLAPTMPTRLTIEAGVGRSMLDLAQLYEITSTYK